VVSFCLLVGTAFLFAQQDLTAQWKLTLSELQQRLAALPDSSEAVAAWRADAEALRNSIATFAAANASGVLRIGEARFNQARRTRYR
jgi:hypothetical protein